MGACSVFISISEATPFTKLMSTTKIAKMIIINNYIKPIVQYAQLGINRINILLEEILVLG